MEIYMYKYMELPGVIWYHDLSVDFFSLPITIIVDLVVYSTGIST
jgi:hypothetical protein